MKKLKENYLDGEKLFRQYFAMGSGASASRLQKFAVTSGMLSPQSRQIRNWEGKLVDTNEPTVMGVWKAMWRWASLKENKDTAFSIFCDHVENHKWRNGDDELPWDEGCESVWKQFMLQKIQSAWQFPISRHNRFLRENSWL